MGVVDFENVTFLPYMGIAVILFAIRYTNKIPNVWIPILAIVLGILFAFWEQGNLAFESFLLGLSYALSGVGTVASVRYFMETKAGENKDLGR